MPYWLIALIGSIALAGTVVPGIRLYWPSRSDPVRRSDLGLALMTGALIAFSVLLLQLLFDIRLAQSDQESSAREDQANFQLFVTRERELAGVDLSQKNMRAFFLQGKDLAGSDMSSSDLRDAVLRHSSLVGANMTDADLRDADLRYANLDEANLEGADLEGAKLAFASLEGTRLRGANLKRTDLGVATLRADLRGAILQGANLYNADLAPANLKGANLRGADLKYATLRGAILLGADFRAAILEGVNFSHATYDWRTRWPKSLDQRPCPRQAKRACRFPAGASAGAREAFPVRLKEFRRLLVNHLPTGWKMVPDPFGITLASSADEAHVYGESIPLPPGMKVGEYARQYDQDFKENYPRFRQYAFGPVALLGGRRGYVRRYGAEGDKGYETSIDLYYVEDGRGYVFVATANAERWPLFQRDFRKLFRTLRVKPDLFPTLGDA